MSFVGSRRRRHSWETDETAIAYDWTFRRGFVARWHTTAAHFLEDQWRVFTIFKYKTPDNTLYFVWDQIIHYAIIFAVVAVVLTWRRDVKE